MRRRFGWVGSVQTDMPTRSQWGRKVRVSVDGWIMLVNPDVLQLADIYRLFVCSLVACKVTES